jgi:HK97 gp10 family phage protein
MARIVKNKGFYTNIEGLQQTLDAFEQYTDDVKNEIKVVVQETSENIQTDAKTEVAKKTGLTSQSIAIKYFSNGMGSTIGPRLPKGYKAHWIEYGTGNRVQKKTGRPTGRMPEMPFMIKSFEANRADYISKLEKALSSLS